MYKRVLIFLLGFFLSSQLGKHFFYSFSYINAVRVDYLSLALYFSDVIVMLILLSDLKLIFRSIHSLSLRYMMPLLVFILLNIVFSLGPVLSFYKYLRVLEVILLYLMLKNDRGYSHNLFYFLVGIGLSAALNLVLGITQILRGSSLQGLSYFLGERSFTVVTPGIATVSVLNRILLRPYGTFSHPNSLAGFYLLLFIFVYTLPKPSFKIKLILCSLFGVLIILSFSKLAIFGLGLFLLLYHWKKERCFICVFPKLIFLSFLILFILSYRTDLLTFYKRAILLREGILIFIKRPILGVGLGDYLLAKNLIKEGGDRFFLQYREPVHNIFLLLLDEIGVLGWGIIAFYLKKVLTWSWIKRNSYLLFFVIYLGMFDHYLLTLQQNFLLLPALFAYLSMQ